MLEFSMPNLVSSENEKACNFQTMTVNSFVMLHDLMRSQIGSYAYMQKRNLKKNPKKHIYIKQQYQDRPAISWKKKIVLL